VGDRLQQAHTLKTLAAAQKRLGEAVLARRARLQAAAIFDELGDDVQAAELRTGQSDNP
jgi:hypothetical protein